MRATLPGIGGSLFPGRYLADRLLQDATALGTADAAHRAAMRRRLLHWWRDVSAMCGPATGLRALFDVAAMPLAAALGFRATSASFAAHAARVCLEPRRPQPARGAHTAVDVTSTPVALWVAPWAHRPPAIWRDAAAHARECGASWCLILATPHLHVLDATGWSRRVAEFSLPDVLEHADSFDRFWAIAEAAAFVGDDVRPTSRIAQLTARAERFQDAVREDLQQGVAHSLASLDRVLPSGTATGEPLAIIYRVLFLLFAESRDLLPWRHPLYGPAYSVGAMCEAARTDPAAAGYWPGLAAVSRLLRVGCRTPELDVRPFNGHLFSRAAAPSLERRRRPRGGPRAAAEDRAIADTLVHLSTRPTRHGREPIAYPDLGVEQLGAVYERVLGHPHRKQSGTFYTPRALTEFVVRRTLTPLTRDASADAILHLRVVDPAMGSGAFLVAACRHLATAYERALVGEGRLSEHEIDTGMRADFRRLVAQRCLYGVDRNPVAVQLARLSLWLATLAGGKPLTFLDHRLRTGDALVGARPGDLRHAAIRRTTAMPLFDDHDERELGRLAQPLLSLAAESDDTVEAVRRKEALWSQVNRDDSTLARWRLASHLWCARWFPGEGGAPSAPELRAAIDALLRADRTLPASALSRWLRAARAQADAHRFFHWPLEFADVFVEADGQPRADAGFDAVIGNPPWEMLRADHDDSGASAQLVRFIRESGLYGACGRGHMNLYQPFLERALDLTREGGQIGLVLPWGLASDDGAATLRARLLDRCRTSTVIGLDNAGAIFPVHRGLRFLALVASPGGRTDELPMVGGVTSAAALERLCDDDGALVAPMRISRGTLARTGGAMRRLPDLRRAGDLTLLDDLTHRWPALGSADGWAVEFGRELNVTEDRSAFSARGLPVIEGKHIRPFATDTETRRFRIAAPTAARLLPGRGYERARLAYRDVSAVSNRQSLIAAIVPAGVVTTHTLFCLKTPLDLDRQHFLSACFNSYVLNAIVRMLMGGHLTTSLIESLPVPPWTGSARQRRISRIGRRLAGAGGSPRLAARLQALVAREYGVDRGTFEGLLRTFPLIAESERFEALSQLLDISMRG